MSEQQMDPLGCWSVGTKETFVKFMVSVHVDLVRQHKDNNIKLTEELSLLQKR